MPCMCDNLYVHNICLKKYIFYTEKYCLLVLPLKKEKYVSEHIIIAKNLFINMQSVTRYGYTFKGAFKRSTGGLSNPNIILNYKV